MNGSIAYPKTAAEWFNPAAFSAPASRHTAAIGLRWMRGPGRDDWNLALLKNFVLSAERGSRIEFRAESFNTWNHTQFKGDDNNGGIGLDQGSGSFGVVSGAFDPREFQLGLKLILLTVCLKNAYTAPPTIRSGRGIFCCRGPLCRCILTPRYDRRHGRACSRMVRIGNIHARSFLPQLRGQLLRLEAIALEQQGKLPEAAQTWRSVIQKNPSDAAAFASLGVILSKEQKYQEAASAYKKAIALNPKLPGMELNLGLAEFKQGNFQAAITPLHAALTADPHSLQAATLLGLSYYGAKHFAEAIKYLGRRRRRIPTMPNCSRCWLKVVCWQRNIPALWTSSNKYCSRSRIPRPRTC